MASVHTLGVRIDTRAMHRYVRRFRWRLKLLAFVASVLRISLVEVKAAVSPE